MKRLLRIPTTPVKVPVPRGFAVSGAEFASTTLPGVEGTNFTKGVQNDYSYYLNKGLVLARVAIEWERAQPSLNGALDATYMGYVDTIINTYAATAGVKVLLEIHNFGGRDIAGNGTNVVKVGSGSLTVAHHNDFWTKLTTRYFNNPNVWGYGHNEPASMPVPTTSSNYLTTSSCTLMVQGMINSIRAVDKDKYIVAPTDGFSGLQAFTSQYGSNPTPFYSDPQNKTYYEFHYYFDGDHSGAYSGAYQWHAGTGLKITDHGDFLITAAQWAINNNVLVNGYPGIFMGEYGVSNETKSIGGDMAFTDPAYLSALNDFMTVMDQYNIPGCHWAGGQWYSSRSALSPGSNYTADRAQMAILTQHLGTIN